jgi:hypothetical protein
MREYVRCSCGEAVRIPPRGVFEGMVGGLYEEAVLEREGARTRTEELEGLLWDTLDSCHFYDLGLLDAIQGALGEATREGLHQTQND